MKDFLEHIAEGFANQGRDVCIIANMHALPSVSQLFKIALNKGFSATNALFIGKPYSTIDTAKNEIVSRGIGFASILPQFPAGQLVPLHNQLLKEQLAQWCPPKGTQDFILLDSGGYLTKEFDRAFSDYKRVSIQLTSSGSRMWPIGAKQLIDLGNLDTKKSNESSVISEVIFTEIEQRIGNLDSRKICVIGSGAIGQNLSQLLAQQNMVYGNAIGTENPAAALNDFDLIIGATGYDISALAMALSGNAEHVDLIRV